jgi:hypothetical protein
LLFSLSFRSEGSLSIPQRCGLSLTRCKFCQYPQPHVAANFYQLKFPSTRAMRVVPGTRRFSAAFDIAPTPEWGKSLRSDIPCYSATYLDLDYQNGRFADDVHRTEVMMGLNSRA